jgi:hypothetical protein
MKRCEECGKKLRLIEGYRHPILGKNFLICSNCFDVEYESKKKWREAHLPYVGFFENDSSNNKYLLNLRKKSTSFIRLTSIIHNIRPKKM